MTFDPTQHLKKVNGNDYLMVLWRLVWLRTEHPDAVILTELVSENSAEGRAVFKAQVILADGGSATGYGSETAKDFRDYLEKAETKAVGRALAMLGYGTQFALVDFNEGPRLVDTPVETPAENTGARPVSSRPVTTTGVTDAQIRAIYAIGRTVTGLTEDEIEAQCQGAYGCLPNDLSRSNASAFIDRLKGNEA